MRIAWVIYGSIDQPTGGYVYDRLVVQGLRARGHIVEVMSLPSRGAFGLLHGPALQRRIATYDVCVGDELCFAELCGAFIAIKTKPIKTKKVLLVHHLSNWERPGVSTNLLERLVARNSHRVIATSHQTAARLRSERICNDVSVCVPGADRLPRLPRLDRDAPLRLLFVGTWTERKGLAVLLGALQMMADRPWHLTVVGDDGRDPTYREALKPVLRALAHKITLAGTLDEAALARVYAAHDTLVLPSFYEGYGMVLTEALHAGLSVVASDVGAVAEATAPGKSAVRLLPPGQPARLAEILSALCVEPLPMPQTLALPRWTQTVADIEAALL